MEVRSVEGEVGHARLDARGSATVTGEPQSTSTSPIIESEVRGCAISQSVDFRAVTKDEERT